MSPVSSAQTKRGTLDRPGCRLYYEVTGAGPAIVFAHGLGGNHLSWWQQVPHFAGRYTCVTFAHRGFAPSSEIPGGPDPADYAGDLGALIDHLSLGQVFLVAQSMGGWACLDYALARPERVRALVLASTAGAIARRATLLRDPPALDAWIARAAAARTAMQRDGVQPAAGARMAREQPALHFLYREVDAIAGAKLDKEALRARMIALQTRPPNDLARLGLPTLFITGEEDVVFPPLLAPALAALMPHARVAPVAAAGHSVYFERAEIFNRLVEEFFSEAQSHR
ncbi:MAG TPA: alpha/beta hydrolase [Xanthobacteraceae bacterium]|nr:alpha/beta hydrolase [Xanthobacteraceae bacterium]